MRPHASIVRSLNGFEQQIRTLFRAISRGRMPLLAQTRDELLPLLMSGKVRVRDRERVASEVL